MVTSLKLMIALLNASAIQRNVAPFVEKKGRHRSQLKKSKDAGKDYAVLSGSVADVS